MHPVIEDNSVKSITYHFSVQPSVSMKQQSSISPLNPVWDIRYVFVIASWISMGYHSYSFKLSPFKVVRYYNDSWFDSQFSLGHQNLFVIFPLNIVWVIRICFFISPLNKAWISENCLYIVSLFSLSNAIFPIIPMQFCWPHLIKSNQRSLAVQYYCHRQSRFSNSMNTKCNFSVYL